MEINVTSATLSDQTLQTVPASITVFTRKQIQQLGVSTLEALMSHVPGYQNYNSDGNSQSYSSRSRRLAANSREVLVLLDGIRLNHDLFGSVGVTELTVSMKNVERVEFLRGPGSAIYGANAFLGVVNVITASGLNEADVSAGSFGQRQASMNISAEIGNFDSNLSVESHTIDGEDRSIYDPVTASFINSQQKIEQQSLYWRGHWSDDVGGGLGLQVRLVKQSTDGGYFAGIASDTFNRFESNSHFFSLHYQHVFNENWELSSRLYNSPYLYQPSQYLAAKEPLVLVHASIKGNDSGIDNQLLWHQGSASALLGFDHTRNSMDQVDLSLQFFPAPSNPPVEAFSTETRRVNAWYMQWQDELSQDLTYILGVRKDSYSDVEGHVSPRLGLIWQADANNSLKLLYGEAFRAPSRNELSIKNNAVQLGNPNLTPEISKTFELVWSQTGTQYYSSVSLFNTEIIDAVEYYNTVGPSTFVNGKTQYMNGVEVEWQWFFLVDWQLRADLSHLFKSPLVNNNDAEELLGVSLIYEAQQVTASLSGRYHGSRRDSNTTVEGYKDWGGYSLFNAHIHYQINPEFQLYSNLRNITDKEYTTPAIQNANNFYGVPGTGREIEVGLRWSFK
ncbi:TonB-dependent receptor [Colwellia sp. 12G3]|uniref:TonB-dependent receptor n=1 Tax=Colwellia sp. 12G3 TaxID=2058299 RepID=UPI0018E2B042|nr:TonB-dependent receptor [Colwellia sp. 12G3]